jgi:hypothetical protein
MFYILASLAARILCLYEAATSKSDYHSIPSTGLCLGQYIPEVIKTTSYPEKPLTILWKI